MAQDSRSLKLWGQRREARLSSRFPVTDPTASDSHTASRFGDYSLVAVGEADGSKAVRLPLISPCPPISVLISFRTSVALFWTWVVRLSALSARFLWSALSSVISSVLAVFSSPASLSASRLAVFAWLRAATAVAKTPITAAELAIAATICQTIDFPFCRRV